MEFNFEVTPCVRCGCADPEFVLERGGFSNRNRDLYRARAVFTCPVCGLSSAVLQASPESQSDADLAALCECARTWAEAEDDAS